MRELMRVQVLEEEFGRRRVELGEVESPVVRAGIGVFEPVPAARKNCSTAAKTVAIARDENKVVE